jgi:hypothetical protein
MDEIYADLKNASPEELLRTVKFFSSWKNMPDIFFVGMDMGFALARPGGWEHVAPAWLRAMRESFK